MRPSLKIALIYIFIGGSWVAFSSLYLEVFMGWFQVENSNYLEAVKAVMFVILSGLIIYAMTERSIRLEQKIREQYVEIFETSPIPMVVLNKEDLKVLASNKVASNRFDIAFPSKGEPFFSEQIVMGKQNEWELIKSGKRARIKDKKILDSGGRKKVVDIFTVPFIFNEKEAIMIMMVDNTEIHQVLLEKDQLNRELKLQNERLREFSFINSHHLRSPLSNIMGIIGLMGEGNKTDKEIVQMLKLSSDKLDTEVRKMNELLSEQGMNSTKGETREENRPKTILFVDDDKVQHMINRRVLLGVQPDLDLHFFANPMEALGWLEDHGADILLLDINMPEMNGWEFLNRLQGNKKQPNVMMLSSSIDPNDEKKSQEYRMVTGFLTKPLNKDSVTELLEL